MGNQELRRLLALITIVSMSIFASFAVLKSTGHLLLDWLVIFIPFAIGMISDAVRKTD